MFRKMVLVAVAALAFPTAALACSEHEQTAEKGVEAKPENTVAKGKKKAKKPAPPPKGSEAPQET